MQLKNMQIVSDAGTVLGEVWEKRGLYFAKVFARKIEIEDCGDYEYTEEIEVPSFVYALTKRDNQADMEKWIAGLTTGKQFAPFGAADLEFADLGAADVGRSVTITAEDPAEELENAINSMEWDAFNYLDLRLEEERKLKEWKFAPNKAELVPYTNRDFVSPSNFHLQLVEADETHKLAEISRNSGGWSGPDDDHFKDWYNYFGHWFENKEALLVWICANIISYDWHSKYSGRHRSMFCPVFKETTIPLDIANVIIHKWDKRVSYYLELDSMLFKFADGQYGAEPHDPGDYLSPWLLKKDVFSIPWIPHKKYDAVQGYFKSDQEALDWIGKNIAAIEVDAAGDATAIDHAGKAIPIAAVNYD